MRVPGTIRILAKRGYTSMILDPASGLNSRSRKRPRAGPHMRTFEGRVEEPGAQRLDVYVADTLGLLSRSQLKSRLVSAFVNGRPVKLSRPLHPADILSLEWRDEPDTSFLPEDIPLSVLYEDERVIVIDKAQGMVTHPAHGNWQGTLANALLGRILTARGSEPRDEARDGAPDRAGIVHRLDKDTSGLIIAAKDSETQAFLSAQFRDRRVQKEYLAVSSAPLPADAGRVEGRMGRDPRDRKRFAPVDRGGKTAVTDWKVLASYGPYRLVALRPRTGRTHQLRVHMKSLGCPILGDPLYGRADPRFPDASLMLHARRLRILLPGRGEPSTFTAKVPERFQRVLAALEAEFGEPNK